MTFVYPYQAVCTVTVRWNWNVIVMKDGLDRNVIFLNVLVVLMVNVLNLMSAIVLLDGLVKLAMNAYR